MLHHKQYLYGTRFEVVVDHEPLVALYNSHSKELPLRVAKHKNKLRAFDFTVVYEPGLTNPSDWGSRNPPPVREYLEEERVNLGVESVEEDSEVLIGRVGELTEAVTMEVLRVCSNRDTALTRIARHLREGSRLEKDLQEAGYKECWEELGLQEGGIITRGERW